MKSLAFSSLVFTALALSACAANPVFPPDALKGVDPAFDFARWRTLPNQAEAKKIQLGGRIVSAETTGGVVTLVVAQLPIVEHPAYGPKETGKRSGEFAITYRGAINSAFLQPGNRLMVVGTTRSPLVIAVDDMPRNLPTVTAACLHFWKTGGRDIADFPSFGGGYETLEEETVCADKP